MEYYTRLYLKIITKNFHFFFFFNIFRTIYETVSIKILLYTLSNVFYFSREIYYFLYKNHLKFVVRSKAHQTDIYTPLFRSLNTDLRLIVHHEYLDIFPCTWPKDNGERKNKQTEKKQANFYAVQTRSFENIACSRVPKNLREGYGCFYHRLSIRPSPDSHSLSYDAFSCVGGAHVQLSFHPTISKPAQLVRN